MQSGTLAWLSYIVLWVVVIVQVALTLALARMVGRISRNIPITGARVVNPGPEISRLMPDLETSDLSGNPVSFRFPRDRGLFLLYISPHCSTCAGLVPSARRFFKEISSQTDAIWVMVSGSQETQLEYALQNGLTNFPVTAEEQLPPGWRVRGAPFGLWIDGAGQVRSKGMVNYREHLESLRNAAEMGHASMESYVSAAAEQAELDRERLRASSQ
jgi:methylamine dehydrogenase accessory protein MauD